MNGIVARGQSGQTFTYVRADSAAARNAPSVDGWHCRPVTDAYRKEWDAFARLLGVNGQSAAHRPLITDAINRYALKVEVAANRRQAPPANARAEAAQEARSAATATATRLTTPTPRPAAALNAAEQQVANLSAPQGQLASVGKGVGNALARDPALQGTDWGRSLQSALTGARSYVAFQTGVVSGVFHAGKDMVVGLATFVGKTVQYGADNSRVGQAMDGLRTLLPSGAQAWMRDQA